jgi:hypothetical protein
MAWTSYGYPGTILAPAWATMISRVGSTQYGVTGTTGWQVTATAGPRAVSIAPGNGWGAGVYDSSPTAQTLFLSSVPTGTRWDMIVVRRTWGTTNASDFFVIEGGSSKALPSRNTNRGVLDDQPIALVRVIAGSNAVQEIVDLRVWPSDQGMIGYDNLALSYMSRPGTVITINGYRWTRNVNSTYGLEWLSERIYATSVNTGTIAPATGFSVDSVAFESRGAVAQLVFTITRTGANMTAAPSDGDVSNVLLGTLSDWACPIIATPLSHLSTGPLVSGYMFSTGEVRLGAAMPGWIWKKGDSIQLAATFIRAGS